MTKKELLDKINNLPDDSRVEIQLPLTANGQQTDLRRNVDYVEVNYDNKQIVLGTNWGIILRF